MSQFPEFRRLAESAIKTCVAEAKTYREKQHVEEVPTSVIQGLVTQHIIPLSGEPNTLNVPILEGRVDWRRHATEVAFRRTLQEFARSGESEDIHKQIVDCLDIVLYCSEDANLLDSVVPVTLIEELFDSHTTKGCEKIFDYVIKHAARITKDFVPGRGKGLVLLRMCNELLRRLSKEINTVFCGRILMFLANTFPLGERSGVNLRGEFNTDMINFDSDEEVDADPDMTEDEKKFYKTFWSTRVFFSNPPTIFSDNNFEKLQQGTSSIVQRFQIIAQKEAEMLGARKSETSGNKRDRAEASQDTDLMEEDPALAEQMLSDINKDFQFPRLLSSRKLLDLEMEDVRFRRNVIVQYLVLLQYISGFAQEEKQKIAELLATRENTKQSLIQPSYVLSQEQIKWIDETRDILETLLRSTKPHGNLYTDIILNILANERHWITWKATGCPTFEKPPISMADLEETWKSKKPQLLRVPRKFWYKYGHPALDKVFEQNDRNTPSLSEFMLNREKVPTAIEAIDKSLDHLYDSMQAPEIRFDYANGAFLQASRLIYHDHPTVLRQAYAAKKEVYRDMRASLNEPDTPNSSNEQQKSKQPTLLDFATNEQMTNDHVEAEIEALKRAKALIIEETSIKIDDDNANTNNSNTSETAAAAETNGHATETTENMEIDGAAANTNGTVENTNENNQANGTTST